MTLRRPSISTSRLRDWTFFTDRDSDGDFHAALVEAGLSVQRHDDHFPPGRLVEDHEWIALCAQNNWIGVTSDKRIRRTPISQKVLMEGGVRLFVNVGKATHAEKGKNFVASLPKIFSFLDAHPPPFIAKVYLRREGVYMHYTLDDYRKRST